MSFLFVGEFTQFSIQALFLSMTSALGLLAVADLIVRGTMLYLMSDRQLYENAMFKQTNDLENIFSTQQMLQRHIATESGEETKRLIPKKRLQRIAELSTATSGKQGDRFSTAEFKILFKSCGLQDQLTELLQQDSQAQKYLSHVYEQLLEMENGTHDAIPMHVILRQLDLDSDIAEDLLEFVDEDHDGNFTFDEFMTFVYVWSFYLQLKKIDEHTFVDKVASHVADISRVLFSDLVHHQSIQSSHLKRRIKQSQVFSAPILTKDVEQRTGGETEKEEKEKEEKEKEEKEKTVHALEIMEPPDKEANDMHTLKDGEVWL